MTKARATVALAILGALGLLLVGARLLGPSDTATERVRPTAAATATAALPPSTPVPSPTNLPTATPVPTTTPEPTVTPGPTSVPRTVPFIDSGFPRASLVQDHVVVRAQDGAWTRQRESDEWNFISYPEGVFSPGCEMAMDDRAVFTHRDTDRAVDLLMVLDVNTQVWDVSQMPRLDADPRISPPAEFCQSINVGGTWVFAAASLDDLVLATTRNAGESFSTERIPLPDHSFEYGDWVRGTFVDLEGSTEGWVAGVSIPLDYSMLDWTWMEIDPLGDVATILQPSAEYGPDPLTGGPYPSMPQTAFSLETVGNEVWQLELQEITEVVDSYEEVEVGTWAAGRVGEPLVRLPYGYKPRLFPYGDAVVAELPLGTRAFLNDDFEVEWWILRDGATQWEQMEASPVVAWRDLPAGTDVSLVGLDVSTVDVIPVNPLADLAVVADEESGE